MSDALKQEMMTSTSTAQPVNVDDGFSGYTSETEGGDEGQQLGLIQGHRIKFGNDNRYTANGVLLPVEFQAIVAGAVRAEIKWHPDKSQRPDIIKILGPNEKF